MIVPERLNAGDITYPLADALKHWVVLAAPPDPAGLASEVVVAQLPEPIVQPDVPGNVASKLLDAFRTVADDATMVPFKVAFPPLHTDADEGVSVKLAAGETVTVVENVFVHPA